MYTYKTIWREKRSNISAWSTWIKNFTIDELF